MIRYVKQNVHFMVRENNTNLIEKLISNLKL